MERLSLLSLDGAEQSIVRMEIEGSTSWVPFISLGLHDWASGGQLLHPEPIKWELF